MNRRPSPAPSGSRGIRNASIAVSHSASTVDASLARRALTVPAYLALASLGVATLPLFLLVTMATDLARRRPWPTTRCLLFVVYYLACEAVGILASAAVWLARAAGTADADSFRDANRRLQSAWANALLAGARRIFALHIQVTGDEAVRRGPFFLFPRHVSIGDTILPATLVSAPHGIRLRYVLKRELLWDPCLDIVGNRLPNYFVRRGGGQSERESAAICALADELGDRDGVLLYPEGTRSTAAKRQRAAEHLARCGETALAESAKRLRHLLPPRLGGTLALLRGHPNVDVVFCAHTGFEGARTLADLFAGSLIGKTIQVEFWRVAAADIPRSPDALKAWLFGQWQRMDDWLEAHLEPWAGARRNAAAR